MKNWKFLLAALFAIFFSLKSEFVRAQAPNEDIPVAEAIPAEGAPEGGENPLPPPPPAEGEEADEKPAFMPTGRVAGAYEPTAAERNEKASAAPFLLAQNGKALGPIVVSTRATSQTRNAATELAGFLEKITGAKWEIRFSDGKPFDYPLPGGNAASRIAAQKLIADRDLANKQKPADPLPQNGLILGTSEEFEAPAGAKEGLAMRGAFHGREAFVIRTDSKRLLLLSNRNGIQHVVTRFLEEMGCRWFGPGEHWAVFPSLKSLSFQKDVTDRPSIGARLIAFMDGFSGANELEDQHAWLRRNYIGASFAAGVGHMWSKLIVANGALIKEHPEYLAMVGGKRLDLWKTDEKGKDYMPKAFSDWAKFELGNPAVRKLFVDYAVNHFKANPDSEMVGVSPNDGGGYSQSPEARALGDGSPSDQLFTMVNEVARALKKEFPGQGKMVGCYAYRDAAAPPSFPLEDNVYVEVALGYNMSKYTTAQLAEMWPKRAKNIGFYQYYSTFALGSSGIPGGPVANIPRITAAVRGDYAHNAAAVFAQSSNAFAMQTRGYLVATRLLWNPNADPDAILADFYDKAFGPAAKVMERFYERLSPLNPRPLTDYTYGAAYRDLDEATKLAQGREDVLWRLADLKMFFHYIAQAKVWGATRPKTQAYNDNYVAMLVAAYQMKSAYMVQWNMIHKTSGRSARGGLLPQDLNKAFDNLPPVTLESVEANFQADFKKQPTREIPYVDFDQTDLVPVEFPPAPALTAGPPVPPPAVPVEGPPTRRDYYQGSTPVYNFYSWKGEPIEVSIIAGIRGSGKSGRIQTWTLRQSDGKGNWKVVEKGEIPADQVQQNLSIKVPGPGSYGFQASFGSLAGFIYSRTDRPVTLVATGAKDFYGPFFYVPKGTKEIWLNYSGFGAGGLGLMQPDGKTLTIRDGVAVIPVPTGTDGQLWRVQRGSKFRGQQFFNVPNLAAPSPETLMVPREVAIKDGLKIREK